MQSETFEGRPKQGGVLSPLSIMMDDIKVIDKERHKVHIGFYKLRLVGLAECAFADDPMVCIAKEDELL